MHSNISPHDLRNEYLAKHYKRFKSDCSQGITPDLSIPEFAACAVEYNREFNGSDKTPNWTAIKLLRGQHQLVDQEYSPEEAWSWIITDIGSRLDGTKEQAMEFLGWGDAEEYEFLTTWELIEKPGLSTALDLALDLAHERPVALQGGIDGKSGSTLYKRFVSFVVWLQRIQGDSPIYLPCAAVGEKLGCDGSMVSRLRRQAVEERIMEKVKDYPKGQRMADEFVVDLSLFNESEEDAWHQSTYACEEGPF